MKFIIGDKVKNLEGKVVKSRDPDTGEEEELTYAVAIGGLCLAEDPDRTQSNKENKRLAFGIASKVYSQNEVELSVEEVNYLIEKAGRVSNPFIFGRLDERLNPKPAPEKPEEAKS